MASKWQSKTIMAPADGIVMNLPQNLILDTSWTDGLDVRFGKGYIEKVGGWEKFLPDQLNGPLMAIENYYQFDGDEWLLLITPTSLYKYNPSTYSVTNITGDTPLTGTYEDVIITDTAQDMFVLTNNKDPIKYYDGSPTGTLSDLPGLTDCEYGPEGVSVTSVRAKCILPYNNMLILGGTTENGNDYPQRIRTSQIGNITKFKNNEDGSGECFVGDLTDGVDWIVRLLPYKNYLVAYKERSIQILNYVGGSIVFDKWPAIVGTGLLAPRAVIDLGDEHLFLGPDNFYSFNFQEVLVAGDDIAEDFFRLLDPSKADLTTSFVVEEKSEAWFVFVSINSTTGYHDMAVVYNYETKKWSFRDMPMTAFGFYNLKLDYVIDEMEMTIDAADMRFDDSTNLANSPLNLCGDANGYIYQFKGNSKDGSDIACFATSKLFDFELPFNLKRLLRIQFMVSREGPYNMLVDIGTAANVDEPIVWHPQKRMSLERTMPPWIDVDVTGRYFKIKLSTLEKDQPFKLTGMIFYYTVRGSR